MSLKFDLRGSRRLHLKKPAPAVVVGGRVEILDVSADSVGVQHDFPLEADSRTLLEFTWDRKTIQLSCLVARTRQVTERPPLYHSGLQIDPDRSPSIDDYRERVESALEKLREAEAKLPPPF